MATPLYPVATIANLFNLTERRVQQLAAEGIIPKADRGKYDLVACVRGYIKYLQDRAFGKDVGVGDVNDHKSRLIKANADMAEMERNVMQAELFNLKDATNVIDKMIMDCKQKLLAIPAKAAPLVHGSKILTQTQDILQNLFDEALHDLTRIDPSNYIPESEIEAVDATAKADS